MITMLKAARYRIRIAGDADPAGPAAAEPIPAPAPPVDQTTVEMMLRRRAAAAQERAGTRPLETAPAPSAEPAADPASLFEPAEDGFGDQVFPTAAPRTGAPGEASAHRAQSQQVLAPKELTPEEEIEAIRAEGLTGRQLRLARRTAQKHGIEATSDFEAVRILRRRGIDPFDRGALLALDKANETAVSEAAARAVPALAAKGSATIQALARIDGAGADTRVQLPQTTAGAPVPAPQGAPPLDEGARAREIIRIQRDIAKRRRRRLALLAARLTFFVFLPTLLAGWYYFAIATPMYATKTEFVIQKADGMSGASGLGSLFSGTQLATNQDSVTVQSFLQSRDAMLRLEADKHFKEHFSQPGIDPLQRLDSDATNEAAYKVYKRNVKIGYDPSEGIVRMEVVAADPGVSKAFSEALISYAEEQVDKLTARLREDQMRGARESYADAEAKVFAAQAKVLDLQEKVGILDPLAESSAVMSQVTAFETELQKKRLELGQLLDNARPSQARVDGVQGDITRLEGLIVDLRKQLTERNGSNESLAAVTGQLRIAEAELATRQQLLAAAAQQMEVARIEANKQVRYLEMGVRPVAPDEPTYPRAFEDTLLAFLIFSGIYLMLSLTASILREQVSS
ncbi:capsule biosynthesis protein [Rhodobacter lacus]|uniref:Capsule biosynthesis protein n=1 Tax=Rhodobacter lacus TaxID=1641972 RepID=A0ABW5A6S2_9RHOB